MPFRSQPVPQPAWIALGSNLGDRNANLDGALRSLRALVDLTDLSSRYETEPVGYLDQPAFLNAAATIRTTLSPIRLLEALLRIERNFGRDRSASVHNGPRTLDLDLLFYGESGSLVLRQPSLTLPHPSLHLRRFVLEPLAEIASDLRHPVLGSTIADLLANLPAEGTNRPSAVRRVPLDSV